MVLHENIPFFNVKIVTYFYHEPSRDLPDHLERRPDEDYVHHFVYKLIVVTGREKV